MNNTIKKYIVKIKYKDFGGSGVIVPLTTTKEYFYIFTAKHTFFAEDTKIIDMNLNKIEDDITIENPIEGSINVNKTNILPDINEEYDLLVFRIKKEDNPQINLEPISVFSDDFKECVVMGYPNAREDKDTPFDTFNCFYKQENNESYTFEMDSFKLLTTHRDINLNPKDTMAGISGSGVYVKGNSGALYLVGIQIQSATHNALIAIDLRKIFDELNSKLNNDLSIGGYQFFEEIGLDMSKLELSRIKEKLLNDEIKEIKNSNSEIDFLEDTKYIRKMADNYNNLQKEMKKLSNIYLYQGIIFHEHRKNQQATNRFKKAITLHPEYQHYFAEAKYQRDNLTQEQKDAKEKIKYLTDTDVIIDSLKSDIESYQKDKNYDALERSYRKIIPFLHEDFNNNENEIINLSKELSKVLIMKEKFLEAEDILLKLDGDDVNSTLYSIYTNENFSKNSSLNEKQFSNKLIDLLSSFNRDSEEYKDIRKRLEELNIFDSQLINFHEKFISLENKYESTITKLTNDIQLLSTHVSDKKLLEVLQNS